MAIITLLGLIDTISLLNLVHTCQLSWVIQNEDEVIKYLMNPKQAMPKLVHIKIHIYIINNFGPYGPSSQNLIGSWVKFDLSNSFIKSKQISPMGFFQNAVICNKLKIKVLRMPCVLLHLVHDILSYALQFRLTWSAFI